MIDFYYYKSPNGRKVLIALEELGLPYKVHWVDLAKGDQHKTEYRDIAPSGKIPAIIDHDTKDGPQTLFESGAILIYLADKVGRLLPRWGEDRYSILAWLSWQVGSQGPMLGQATHFFSYARSSGIDDDYAIKRYTTEARRCYAVMEEHLATHEWFGSEFSIADIALFPWTRTAKGHGVDLNEFPNVKQWSQRIAARPSANVKPVEDEALGAKAGRVYDTKESQKALFGEAFSDNQKSKEATR